MSVTNYTEPCLRPTRFRKHYPSKRLEQARRELAQATALADAATLRAGETAAEAAERVAEERNLAAAAERAAEERAAEERAAEESAAEKRAAEKLAATRKSMRVAEILRKRWVTGSGCGNSA